MRQRVRALAVVAVFGMISGVLGSIPAAADHGGDDHSKNIKELARQPIKVGDTKGLGSDLTFKGNLVIAGSYQGTAFYRILKDKPYIKQIGLHACPGSQGDVSVWGDLLFVSIDSTSSNSGDSAVCNNTGTTGPGDKKSESSVGLEGLRIVDISNPARARQVGFVETDCGSHTHTLLPKKGELYVYITSYPLSGQGPSCNHVAHRKFSIIKVDEKNPAKSDVIGLDAGFLPPDTIGCHDFTYYPARDLAIGACLGVWLTLDVSNPAKPNILSETRNPLIELDHSSAITWDGKIALIGDEHAGAVGGGGCSPDSESTVGAMWFYDISGKKVKSPELLSHHSLPRVPPFDDQFEAQYFRCTTHNFNVLPMKNSKKYIVVSSYYMGGLAAIDFSDPENPKEIGHYLPLEGGTSPDMWSAYWYNGRIYTNEHQSALGVSVYELKGTTSQKDVKFFKGDTNPQTQLTKFK